MKYAQLGQSDIKIPVIGQGADSGPAVLSSFEDSVRYGIDQGMNFVDTAESYGQGMSEVAVGKAIKGIRDQVTVATKVLSDNLTYDSVIESAENSLQRLGIECIDLYQIHWPNSDVHIHETMSAFEKLYEDGKIRLVGVSNFLPMEIEASEHTMLSFGGLVSNQMEYSLYDRFAEQYNFPYCKKNNLTVICYCPLARGKLCRNEHFSLLKKIAKKYEKTPAQIALNWITLRDGVIAIPFSSNLQHIKENAEATDFQLSSADIELINNSMTGEITYCKADDIKINPAQEITFSHPTNKVYQNVEEAVENKFDFCPSPVELANFLASLSEKDLNAIKPIKAVRTVDDKYELIEGRIRYWSWIIAFGLKKDIPLYIVD